MNTKKTQRVLLALVLALMLALALPLAACGGGQSDEGSSAGEAQQEQTPAGESPEAQVERYIAGYDQISEEFTISNPNPLHYDYVCGILGNEGKWLAYDDEEYTWVPYEGTPVPGEEIALEYSVEGVNGSVLVMWSKGKDYTTDSFSSISNTLERS